MTASHREFRQIATLVARKDWTLADNERLLPVERVRFWTPVIMKAHIAHHALRANLEGTLLYNKDDDGVGWRELVSSLLIIRARVLLALMAADQCGVPLTWMKDEWD